jgi:hypothetical protein
MTVFLNLPYKLIRLGEKDREVCQMVAYTLEELHDFSELLGLTRKDFEDCVVPHYLVPLELRDKAFNLGAQSSLIQDLSQITTLRKRQTVQVQSAIQKEVRKRGRKKKCKSIS